MKLFLCLSLFLFSLVTIGTTGCSPTQITERNVASSLFNEITKVSTDGNIPSSIENLVNNIIQSNLGSAYSCKDMNVLSSTINNECILTVLVDGPSKEEVKAGSQNSVYFIELYNLDSTPKYRGPVKSDLITSSSTNNPTEIKTSIEQYFGWNNSYTDRQIDRTRQTVSDTVNKGVDIAKDVISDIVSQ